MGWVEKWNKFAKKSIYINEALEIGCGRLIFSGIIVTMQIIWGIWLGGDPIQIMPALLTFVMSLKQSSKNKKEED